jgi:hypothetical protein
MKSILSFLFPIIILTTPAIAQSDLFGSTKEPSRKGIVIGFNGNVDVPGADMAKRFGTSFRVGPSFMYKTESNYMFGAKADFIFGNVIKEDSLLYGIHDKNGFIINKNGERIGIGLFERGYAIGLQAGKIFPFNPQHPNTGLLIMSGAGFIQHRINITDNANSIPQISGDYKKGYDRLTNGWYLEQYAGFNRFDKGGLINFHVGLNLMAGFTKGRRDYLYDVMRTDSDSRIDLLFGLRAGIYIPVFRKKSEEIFFE